MLYAKTCLKSYVGDVTFDDRRLTAGDSEGVTACDGHA
jgi:hypothetical protein